MGSSVETALACRTISYFVCKFTDLIRSAFKNIATINSDAIFKEHKSPTTSSTIDEAANQLIFEILSTIYEATAYSLISPYSKADDDNVNDRDGCRAFFALLREFFPRTTNSAGDVERKLRNFKFTTDKSKNVVQRAEFRTTAMHDGTPADQTGEVQRGHRQHRHLRVLEVDERQDQVRAQQQGRRFRHNHDHSTNDQRRRDDQQAHYQPGCHHQCCPDCTQGPPQAQEKTSTSVTSRTRSKFDGPPPYPCKYCPGEELHWGRDCPRLAELERTKETKHKLAAVTHQTLSQMFVTKVEDTFVMHQRRQIEEIMEQHSEDKNNKTVSSPMEK
eukprot:1176060-Prorocentrum_minimum.AAC.1